MCVCVNLRYDEYFSELEAQLLEEELMLTYMMELEYDIRIDMNNLLFTYCQAFWCVFRYAYS